MKTIETRTRNKDNSTTTYKTNLSNAIVFLRHDEDKIIVRNAEQVEIEIYDNGKLIFSGSKIDFFDKLKTKN